MNHLLFWDMPDDRRLSYALADRYPEFVITPMSYAATLTCRRYYSDRYLPFESIVSSSERKKLFAESNRLIDLFYAGINPKAPSWCHAIPAKYLAHSIYYMLLANLFVTNAMVIHPASRFIVYQPLGLAFMPNLSRTAYLCFSEVLATHSYAITASRRERFGRLSSRVVAAIYRPQAHHPPKAKADLDKQGAHAADIDVLLVALEESDRRNQAPLMEKLSAHSDVSVHWLAVEGDCIGLSADESQLAKNVDGGFEKTSIAPGFRLQNGKHIRFGSIKRMAIKWWFYEAFRNVFGARMPSIICWRMAVRFANQQNNLEERHLAVQRQLRAFNTKVMVVNSFLQAMRSVQLEAERRSIPMVLLPHGVSDLQGPEAYWRADAVGRFGRLEREMLADQFPERRATFHAIGAGHLGRMAMQKGPINPAWPEGKIAILFPTTIPQPFKPHSPLEIMEDAETLVRAGMAVGAKTLVRCHPRQKHHNYFDYEMMLERIDSSGWALSDGADSLVESLRTCHIVVVSHYSGAVLQALYAPRPIVCWMPRPYTPFSDQVLERFPCRATTREELVAVFRRIEQEPAYREKLLREQKALLAELVSDPHGDPYAGQEKLVLHMLEKVRG